MTTLMLSTVTYYSAFGQFSATLEEPITTEPTTTPAVGQNNTTSSTTEEEGPIIDQLEFMSDGTGWLTLNSSGKLSPIIQFNHNLTAANGYTIYYDVPFYTNNGTQVPLDNIDFSSQVALDPNANVTLPANPNVSPDTYPQYGSLPPPTPSPPTTTPTAPTPPPAASAATDPELQRFEQIANGCKATIQRLYPGAQTLQDIFLVPPQGATSADFRQMTQCNQLLNQAIAQYCNILQTYDAAKCAYVNTPETLTLIDMTAIIAESDFLYSPDR
jgi:hypothetical protein